MYSFRMRVAGHVAEINANYPGVYCSDFVTEATPDFRITVGLADIERERLLSEASGLDVSAYGDSLLEITVVHRLLSNQLAIRNVLAFHGAAIALHGKAFVFSGPSGVGKTTHILKWLIKHKDAKIINGDKPFITASGKPIVWGSPWSGKERLYSVSSHRLDGILFLNRSKENKLQRLKPDSAFIEMYKSVYLPDDVDARSIVVRDLKLLAVNLSFWRFAIDNHRDDCLRVAEDTLFGQ